MGVFVDHPWQEVVEIAREVPLDAVQLHGREEPAYLARLREALPQVSLIKALATEPEGESPLQPLEQAGDYASLVEAYLLDAARGAPGGTGRPFSWEVLDPAPLPRPFFLAGGLRAENVGRALSTLRPAGVDVSSGVEREGEKDPSLVRRFLEEVRKWERSTSGPT